jgi:hypothetical protein
MHEFPETLEEITVWRLEQVDPRGWYLHYVFNHTVYSHSIARAQVLNWLVRIRKLGSIVQCTQLPGRKGNWLVRVAGVRVCTVTRTQHNEIRGETRV